MGNENHHSSLIDTHAFLCKTNVTIIKIMKTLPLMKAVLLTSVFLTAMAFSCQDHHAPDPDPVENCERIDGTARAFPCEFEITKLEFLRNNTNSVVRTLMQGDTGVALPINASLKFQWLSMRTSMIMEYRVRVHVKRVANPSFQPVGGYEVFAYRLSPPGPPGFPFPPIHDDLIGTGLWAPPASPPDKPANFNMAIGETRAFETVLYFDFVTEIYKDYYFGKVIVSVINNTTNGKLLAAPYNYDRFRDVHEARIEFRPRLDCEPGANCGR
jgi:hypothetical protein